MIVAIRSEYLKLKYDESLTAEIMNMLKCELIQLIFPVIILTTNSAVDLTHFNFENIRPSLL